MSNWMTNIMVLDGDAREVNEVIQELRYSHDKNTYINSEKVNELLKDYLETERFLHEPHEDQDYGEKFYGEPFFVFKTKNVYPEEVYLGLSLLFPSILFKVIWGQEFPWTAGIRKYKNENKIFDYEIGVEESGEGFALDAILYSKDGHDDLSSPEFNWWKEKMDQRGFIKSLLKGEKIEPYDFVVNRMRVTGESIEVQQMITDLKNSETGTIDFNKIIPLSKESYLDEELIQIGKSSCLGDGRLYEAWGTGSNAKKSKKLSKDEKNSVKFETMGCPPIKVIDKLSEKYPDFLFELDWTHRYECGQVKYRKGKEIFSNMKTIAWESDKALQEEIAGEQYFKEEELERLMEVYLQDQ